jgi:hypothetical protein
LVLKIYMDNRNRLLDLAGRNSKATPRFGGNTLATIVQDSAYGTIDTILWYL